MEPYFDQVSIISETASEDSTEQIRECISKMQAICELNEVKSHYVLQCQRILANDIFNHNLRRMTEENFDHPLLRKQKVCEEPLKILQDSLIETLRHVSVDDLPEELNWWALNDEVPVDIRMHPFLDSILYELGRKNQFSGDWVKAQQFLDQLIALREKIYGEGSINLLKPIYTVAQVLRLQSQPNECQAIIDQGLSMISRLLREPEDEQSTHGATVEEVKEGSGAGRSDSDAATHDEIKNPSRLLSIYETRTDLYYMQQRMEASSHLYRFALATADKLISYQRQILALDYISD